MRHRRDEGSSPLAVLPPDLQEQRENRYLLVWGDAPHWMVVDEELAGAIGSPGRLPAGTIPPELSSHFRGRGILQGERSPSASERVDPRSIESVAVNLTDRCNLRCTYCYNQEERGEPAGDSVSGPEVDHLLRALRPYLSRRAALLILGGEPLLHPERTLAVAKAGRRRGLRPVVSTNGTCIDRPFAVAARRRGLQVQVSVDGGSATTHDRHRGEGVFDRALMGVRLLVDQGVHTILSMVCHADNVDELKAFYRLALATGVAEARFIPLKRMGGGAGGPCRPVPLPALLGQAAALFGAHPEYRRLAGRDALSILAGTCRLSARQESCGTGRRTLLVEADGGLHPCLNHRGPEREFGHIRQSVPALRRLWRESDRLQAVRRETAIEGETSACRHCPVRHWCRGGCRGETLRVSGSITARAPDCRDRRRAVLDTFWLLAEQPELAAASGQRSRR